MSLLPVGFGGGASAYDIAKSVRFRSSGSAALSRTPASAGNRLKWTWSAWAKRGQVGTAASPLFSTPVTPGGSEEALYFASDALAFVDGSVGVISQATGLFRDPSAWYHIVFVYDSANATQANRGIFYVNGVQQTNVTNAIGPSRVSYLNNAALHTFCTFAAIAGYYFDGNLSEINFVDGQALDATSFGQFDANGVWQPKRYSGTYGTNGFYLPFSNGTSLTTLAQDRSGNGNNFTASGVSLTAGVNYDWMDDTPTNNFAVLNPINAAMVATVVNANISFAGVSDSNQGYVSSTLYADSGSWYFELQGSTYSGVAELGISVGAIVGYRSDGTKDVDGANSAYGASWTSSDVIGCAWNASAKTVEFFKNNTSQGVFSYASTGLGTPTFWARGTATHSGHMNFGQRPFAYTPPTGFKAISTKNRPTGGSITTSGTFTGNASTDGPFVWLNGNPSTMTINGNAVTFGTHADKTAGGFKVRSSSASYNTAGSNTYSVTVTGKLFGDSSRAPNTAQGNP